MALSESVRDPEMSPLARLLSAGAMQAAPGLLGCALERRVGRQTLRARIVETEAYTADDPASHSFRGLTRRNAVMFESPGTAYIYVSYGIHHCMNVVTGEPGVGEAVLIRAVEPLEGIELMRKARAGLEMPTRGLCNGPGKLCKALSVTLKDNGSDLLAGGRLRLLPGTLHEGESVATSPRVGISKAVDWPRRFLISGNLYASRPA